MSNLKMLICSSFFVLIICRLHFKSIENIYCHFAENSILILYLLVLSVIIKSRIHTRTMLAHDKPVLFSLYRLRRFKLKSGLKSSFSKSVDFNTIKQSYYKDTTKKGLP